MKVLQILIMSIVIILSGNTHLMARKRKKVTEEEKLRKEMEVIQNFLENSKDSLQSDIKERWRKKQQYIEQRELDKEAISELREREEIKYNDLSRIKEECFTLEKRIDEEKKQREKGLEEWRLVTVSIDEVFTKIEKDMIETFPLNMEKKREEISSIRNSFDVNRNPKKSVDKLLNYYEKNISLAKQVTTSRQTVLPDQGEAKEMKILRFGDVFAYALTNAGTPFIIRQTGALGAGKYKIDRIDDSELSAFVQSFIPEVIAKRTIKDAEAMDIMQNTNTDKLITGQQSNSKQEIIKWFRAGGLVMFPLAFLLVWALLMIVFKIVQYSLKHKTTKKMHKKIDVMLKEGTIEKALTYAENHKGVVARAVATCLKHSEWNRNSAESAVKEILIEEVPLLNKYLSTLGVIAGAAPLLGLLGTVTGMIHLFTVITQYGTSDPKILAGGISEALITTQTGLAIAIPLLLTNNYLKNKSLSIQNEMQKHVIRILNRLWPEAQI
jgi:biopolymer transport protein ExbB